MRSFLKIHLRKNIQLFFIYFRFIIYMKAQLGMDTDGLSSLNYKLLKIEHNFLFTRFYVEYKDNYAT